MARMVSAGSQTCAARAANSMNAFPTTGRRTRRSLRALSTVLLALGLSPIAKAQTQGPAPATGQTTASGPQSVVSACPNWMGADSDALFWVSQFDDGTLHKMAGGGPVVGLGRGCSRMTPGSLQMDRDALFCTDGNWQNILRMDKATGNQALLRVAKPLRGPIRLVDDQVVLGYAEPNELNRLAALPKQGGPLKPLAAVAGAISTFDADRAGVVWLDQDGAIWSLPAQALSRPVTAAAPPARKLADARVCSRAARMPTDCALAIDADYIFLSVQPRCGSHDPCPKNTARIERMPRGGGGWVSVAFSLRTVQNMQVDGDNLTWADCLGGTISRMPRKGGTTHAFQAPGACWAYAASDRELLWFNGGKKLDWSDCSLQRTKK